MYVYMVIINTILQETQDAQHYKHSDFCKKRVGIVYSRISPLEENQECRGTENSTTVVQVHKYVVTLMDCH